MSYFASAAPSSWAASAVVIIVISTGNSRACLPTGGDRRLGPLSTGASRFGRCRYWCVCCVGPWRSRVGGRKWIWSSCRRARLIDFCCPPWLGVERTRRSDDSRKSWRRLQGHHSLYSNSGFSTVPCERRSRSSRICASSAARGSLARERYAGLVMSSAALQHLVVRQVVHVLQDRHARHQPCRQRRLAGIVRIHFAELAPNQPPVDLPAQPNQRMLHVDDLVEPGPKQILDCSRGRIGASPVSWADGITVRPKRESAFAICKKIHLQEGKSCNASADFRTLYQAPAIG
jgi:hypothetical protein